MMDLTNYITKEPDELIIQCIAITQSALSTEDAVCREALLYVLIERQILLAKVLDAL